jgi:hypothetical protein
MCCDQTKVEIRTGDCLDGLDTASCIANHRTRFQAIGAPRHSALSLLKPHNQGCRIRNPINILLHVKNKCEKEQAIVKYMYICTCRGRYLDDFASPTESV